MIESSIVVLNRHDKKLTKQQSTSNRIKKEVELLFAIALFFYCLMFPSAIIADNPESTATKTDSLWRNLAPKLYIQDETWADLDYIKSEIIFVNYVRDRTEADIHLIITYQKTGDGGREYCLTFKGMGSYHDIGLVLKHTTAPDATADEIRKVLADTIKRGLVPYVSRTKLRDRLKVEFSPPSAPPTVYDPWHNWVFSVSLYGYATGVKAYTYLYYDLCPDIKRVTENQKIELGADLTANVRRYVLEDEDSVIIARSRGYNVFAIYARKLTSHFTAGGWGEYLTNDYNNVRLGFAAAPRFEYNLVPYSEYVRHKIYLQFVPSVVYRRYFDTTLYDRMGETRFKNELTLGVDMTRTWGTIGLSATGSHYFHDFSKNRLSLTGEISLGIVAGLSVAVGGGYDIIHDQLSLRKEGATEEERLLRLHEMETSYSFWTTLSLTYTFGSIFSNIVNPIF